MSVFCFAVITADLHILPALTLGRRDKTYYVKFTFVRLGIGLGLVDWKKL